MRLTGPGTSQAIALIKSKPSKVCKHHAIGSQANILDLKTILKPTVHQKPTSIIKTRAEHTKSTAIRSVILKRSPIKISKKLALKNHAKKQLPHQRLQPHWRWQKFCEALKTGNRDPSRHSCETLPLGCRAVRWHFSRICFWLVRDFIWHFWGDRNHSCNRELHQTWLLFHQTVEQMEVREKINL